jgi:hypothetical protein
VGKKKTMAGILKNVMLVDVFLKRILSCNQWGDHHPENNLTNFRLCTRYEILKEKKKRILLYYSWLATRTYNKNMTIWKNKIKIGNLVKVGPFFAWKDHLHSLKSYFSCAFSEPHQTVQNCWAKTNLLSQTGMFLTFLCPIFIAKVTYWAQVKLL